MKKIFKVTNWDTSNFSSANVLNKTHWMVKALDTCFGYLGIGNYSLSYSTTSTIILTTDDYGQFTINKPSSDNSTPYIFYVNSDTKELFGCCSLASPFTFDIQSAHFGISVANAMRGSWVSSSTNSISRAGGYFGLKFKQSEGIIGSTSGTIAYNYSSAAVNTITNANCPLLSMDGAYAQPLIATQIRYSRAPIIEQAGTIYNIWRGEMFESIFNCEKYFLGALKTADNTKFVYDGYLFIVDNASDIGVIDT